MKMLELDFFHENDAAYSAIFFTAQGIIIEAHTLSFILNFEKTVKILNLTISNIYLDDSTMIVRCQSQSTDNFIIKNGFQVCPVKAFLASNDREQDTFQILRAYHWLTWEENFQFCSKCGSRIKKIFGVTEKKCLRCNLSFFPNLSPAIMVLIQHDDEILLARSAHFKPGVYSALAGFIDVGETAELAVHREVKEEVGLDIFDLEYFGTQSWPFPGSFMIAFKAKYLKGEINRDENEIEDARWFSLKELPVLPAYPSISKRLIDSYLLNNR